MIFVFPPSGRMQQLQARALFFITHLLLASTPSSGFTARILRPRSVGRVRERAMLGALGQDAPASAIADATLSHYSQRAVQFWEGTKDHDVSQNRAALLRHLPQDRPLRLLDLGCGPGRDVLYFSKIGHEVTGLDGCREFVQMAKQVGAHHALHVSAQTAGITD